MVVIAVVLIFVLISLDPPQVLFMIFLGYSLSGPLFASVRLYQRRRSNRKRRTQAPRRL
jgi:CDP-diacylglycerol--serine O-phosphatidyltransferase